MFSQIHVIIKVTKTLYSFLIPVSVSLNITVGAVALTTFFLLSKVLSTSFLICVYHHLELVFCCLQTGHLHAQEATSCQPFCPLQGPLFRVDPSSVLLLKVETQMRHQSSPRHSHPRNRSLTRHLHRLHLLGRQDPPHPRILRPQRRPRPTIKVS